MKRILLNTLAYPLLLTCLLCSASLAAPIYPERVSTSNLSKTPYRSTGVLLTEVNGELFRGSAVVARDPRLLYTCAHVVYDEGIWADQVEFALRWNSMSIPHSELDGYLDRFDTVVVRGYRFNSSYSGGDSATAFSQDFAIGYSIAGTTFGPAVDVYTDGGAALRNESVKKLVLGYPTYLDYTYDYGYYYMHATGPFSKSMTRSLGSYHILKSASTGPGNSGGPVLAFKSGKYSLAGILVSGSRRLMGVHGLNAAANTMATNTLSFLGSSDSETVRTVATSAAVSLPDGSTKYTARSLPVFYLPYSTTDVKLSISITTDYAGDIDAYVRSPAGRVQWINRRSLAQNTANIAVTDADYTATYAGTNPNGDWRIFMRDYYHGDLATFQSASITVTSE